MKDNEAHLESVSGRLATYLAEHKETMTNEWVAHIRKDSAIQTESMTKPEIVNHIPQVFDGIIQALRKHRSNAAMEQIRQTTTTHTITRWQQHYCLHAVLHEISHLRVVFIYHLHIFEELHPDFGVVPRLFASTTIHRILDEVAIDATDTFLKASSKSDDRNA